MKTPIRGGQLPPDESLPIEVLSRAFNNTTAAYKFFWFRAILKLLHSNHYQVSRLNLYQIRNEMLALAWIPSQYFQLSFGAADKTTEFLETINISPEGNIRTDAIREKIERFAADKPKKDLLRWVPYRFLSCWFETELRGIPDQRRNTEIQLLSQRAFASKKPLYMLADDTIDVHPDWMRYLAENQVIVGGWAKWSLMEYLQARNVSIPNIGSKIEIPDKRSALTKATKRWNSLAASERLHCPYSGARLREGDFTLDHYIPWSYVAHDEPWILVPVAKTPSVNSMKGNSLPHEEYLPKFLKLQDLFLRSYLQSNEVKRSYQVALRLSEEEIGQKKIVKKRLEDEIKTLMSGARRLGFRPDWRFSGPAPSSPSPTSRPGRPTRVSSEHAPSCEGLSPP